MSNVPELPKTMNCGPSASSLRIGVVYSRIPFPMMRGDQVTVAHLLQFLSARGHEVDFYTLDLDGALSVEQADWLQSVTRSLHVYQQSRLKKVAGLLRGALRLTPLQISIFRNSRMAEDVEAAVRDGRYDIVYCYYPRTAMAVPILVGHSAPQSFLALQLSQTLNTRRMAENETRWWKRQIFKIETRLMSRFESRIWRRFHRVALIGPADVEAVREQCRSHDVPEIDNWFYGAHGTDTEKYVGARPEEIIENRVVFSGSMLYPPNVQAVEWFVAKVWPRIRQEVPTAEFVIQGRDPVSSIRALDGQAGIWVTGTVPDVGEIIRSAHVCVNPMLAAGGMQNKLLEYMASGKAVVASSIANEGIMAPEGTLVVRDEPEAFAQAVLSLLADKRTAAELGDAAREYVLENWTWEKHFLDLENEFVAAIGASR